MNTDLAVEDLADAMVAGVTVLVVNEAVADPVAIEMIAANDVLDMDKAEDINALQTERQRELILQKINDVKHQKILVADKKTDVQLKVRIRKPQQGQLATRALQQKKVHKIQGIPMAREKDDPHREPLTEKDLIQR